MDFFDTEAKETNVEDIFEDHLSKASSHNEDADLFEVNVEQKPNPKEKKGKQKQDRFEDLFEEDASEASSYNEDAELFEANFDMNPELYQTSLNQEETEEIMSFNPNYNKENVPRNNAKASENKEEMQTELDEKLDEFKERADRIKNKKDGQKVDKKKENLKAFVIFQTLIMRNPQHYDSFMKLYTLCIFSRWRYYTKMCNSKHILAFVLSKLDIADFDIVDRVKKTYGQDPKYNFTERILSLVGVMLRNFPYEKFNDHHILFNLCENGTYSYENILMIFYCLLKYVGIPVRIVSAIDLACLNVNKKHFYVAPGQRMPGTKGPVRKRKLDQMQSSDKNAPIAEEFKPKLKQGKLNKKSFSSMITSFTTAFVDANDEQAPEEDFMGLYGDSMEDANSQMNRWGVVTKQDREFDSKLSTFAFGGGSKRVSQSTSSETNDDSTTITLNLSNKGKANKTNISKFAFNKKNSTTYEVDLSEFKFWLEVLDLNQKKWVHVEPLKKKVYEDNEEIRKRLHACAPLFIIAIQKYEFSKEAQKYNLEKYKKYYVRDVSVNYIERWHKLLVSRGELNLYQWWRQVAGHFKFMPGISNDFWAKINKWEDERREELEKKDIPQTPKEFRFSRYYILPSMLKKYQAFRPEAKPLSIKFHEEPIYERSGVCELHSKARWRRDMRQVKEGEEPAKKILSLVGNGEQLVDLYGHWQTEPFENKLQNDGSLPKNEYGNYEIMNGVLPEGVVYINLQGLGRVCKKLGIQYVEAMTGFEVGKAGRAHAVISGVIAFAKDEEIIRDAYEKYKDYIAQKEKEKTQKTVIGLWKGIFRKVLVKKYILETYQKENDHEVAMASVKAQ